jgi:hypothetical protein
VFWGLIFARWGLILDRWRLISLREGPIRDRERLILVFWGLI